MSGILSGLLGPIIDKVVPDANTRKEAKVKMLELEQSGQFRDQEMQLEAIMAEANSEDPWTSRARPSFMYVIYIFLLSAIPFGIISVFYPEASIQAAEGMKHWFEAIPDELLALFGVGYVGYTGARTLEKRAREKGKQQKQGFFKRLFN